MKVTKVLDSSGAGTYNLHTSHEFNPLIFSGVYVAIYYVKKMFCQTLFVFEISICAIVLSMLRITDSDCPFYPFFFGIRIIITPLVSSNSSYIYYIKLNIVFEMSYSDANSC
jgi:hypothetical protein